MPVPVTVEIFNHSTCCCCVIRGKAGQVPEAQGLSIVGQQNAGYCDLLKLPSKTIQISAQKQESLGAAQLDQLNSILHFVGIFI